MVFARNLVNRRAYFPPRPRSHSHKATGFSEYFQFLTLGHLLLDSSKRSARSSPIQKTSVLVDKDISPGWMGLPLFNFFHVSPFYLYASRMHSSHLYAFVCIDFGVKSLILLGSIGITLQSSPNCATPPLELMIGIEPTT